MKKKYEHSTGFTGHNPVPGCSLLTLLILISTMLVSCSQKAQPGTISAQDLIGDWSTIQGYAESLTFAEANGQKQIFTYLNSRPFETGVWELKQNKLLVKFDSGEEIEYKATISGRKDLILRKSNGNIEHYEKIFTPAEKLTHWGIELGKRLKLSFSRASSQEFAWQTQADETGTSRTFFIQGYQITALIPAPSRTHEYITQVNAIKNYFDSIGFFNDPYNIKETASEAVTSKIRYQEIIQVITSKLSGPTGDSPVKINLGLLPY